jgi:hypothetical protein
MPELSTLDFDQLKSDILKGRITVKTYFRYSALKEIIEKRDLRNHKLLLLSPFLQVVFLCITSIFTKQWFFLCGILLIPFAFMLTSNRNPFKLLMGGVTGTLFVFSFFGFHYSLQILAGILFLSFVSFFKIREAFDKILLNKILLSPDMLLRFVWERQVILFDTYLDEAVFVHD